MKSAEDLEKEWWDRWWKQDWSWDGPRFNEDLGDGMTLQDYWRGAEEDPYRVAPSASENASGQQKILHQDPFTKKEYTRFHLPLTWSDRKTPTPKARWTEEDHQALADHLTRMLKPSQRPNGPAPFQGTVLERVPALDYSIDHISVIFDYCWLVRGTHWSKHSFDKTSFRGTAFCAPTNFFKARFMGGISFEESIFLKPAFFEKAAFKGKASFNETHFCFTLSFDGATFTSRANFSKTHFSEPADFNDVTFREEINFGVVRFSEQASFKRSIFVDVAKFNGANFGGYVWFDEARFEKPACFRMASFSNHLNSMANFSFSKATFSDEFAFEPKEFPLEPAYAAGAFSGVQFEQDTFFDSEVFFAPAAFDGAILGNKFRLYKNHFDPPGQRTPKIMREYIKAVAKTHPAYRHKVIRSISDGAQTLQSAMQDAGRRKSEDMFHRLELMTRAAMLPSINSRRILTNLYQWTSDFGSSVARPLAFLALAWFLCGVSYWTIHTGFVKSCLYYEDKTPCAWAMEVAGESSWADAFTFSSTATFRPFYVWTLNDERSGGAFADKLLFGDQDADTKTGAREFWVKFLATAQSLFSIVMLFLSGLAARRYYQVS